MIKIKTGRQLSLPRVWQTLLDLALNLPRFLIILLIQLSSKSKTADKLIDLSKFHKGDAIQIQEGVLKGQQAIFSHYDGQMRAIVLLKILHQEQILTIKEGEINYA